MSHAGVLGVYRVELLAFGLLILWLASGAVAASVASAKGWSGSSWFWAGFLLGPAGLLGAVGMPDRLLRKYIRQIAAKQEAIGAELIRSAFRSSGKNGDEVWRGLSNASNLLLPHH